MAIDRKQQLSIYYNKFQIIQYAYNTMFQFNAGLENAKKESLGGLLTEIICIA